MSVRMVSQAYHEVEYDDTSVHLEDPSQEFGYDQGLSFQKKDGYDYMKKTKNDIEFKRKEENKGRCVFSGLYGQVPEVFSPDVSPTSMAGILRGCEENKVWAEMDNIHLSHFLKNFPAMKKQLEKFIQHLRKIANSIDKTNKNCTKVRMFANFTSAFSNICNIGGLALAPVTAGGSLGLSIAGIGFGAVAGVTSLATTAYKSINDSKKMETVKELVIKCQKSLRNVMHPHGTDLNFESPVDNGTSWEKINQLGSIVVSGAFKISIAVKGIRTNVQALKLANANPAMKALGKQAAAAGNRSGKRIRNVRKVFAGTPLALSKGARVLGSLSSLVLLLQDAHSIYQDSQHLKKGDPAETAEKIRKKADELEKELNSLNMFYEEKRFA